MQQNIVALHPTVERSIRKFCLRLVEDIMIATNKGFPWCNGPLQYYGVCFFDPPYYAVALIHVLLWSLETFRIVDFDRWWSRCERQLPIGHHCYAPGWYVAYKWIVRHMWLGKGRLSSSVYVVIYSKRCCLVADSRSLRLPWHVEQVILGGIYRTNLKYSILW